MTLKSDASADVMFRQIAETVGQMCCGPGSPRKERWPGGFVNRLENEPVSDGVVVQCGIARPLEPIISSAW